MVEIADFSKSNVTSSIEKADQFLNTLQSIATNDNISNFNVLIGGSTGTGFDPYERIVIGKAELLAFLNSLPDALDLQSLFEEIGLTKPPEVEIDEIDTSYSNTLSSTIESTLLNNLNNGGFGIPTNDEVQIWNRGREREIAGMQQSIEETNRRFSSLGFSIPPGSVNKQQERAVFDADARIASFNREQTIERARLFNENYRFTIDRGETIDQYLRNFFIQQVGIAIDVIRLKLDKFSRDLAAEIADYQANVARINAELDEYRADISKYAAQNAYVNSLLERARDIDRQQDINKQNRSLENVELLRTQLEQLRIQSEYYRGVTDNLGDSYNALLNSTGDALNVLEASIETTEGTSA